MVQKPILPANILLVEDREADAELVKFTLSRNKVQTNLHIVENGYDALDFVNKRNGYEDKPRPDLILLDINLPGISGIEVLQEIKKNEKTRVIPVVILTSSKHDEDVIKSYTYHANCYIQKPLDLDSFQEIIAKLEQFWFSIVVLPNKE